MTSASNTARLELAAWEPSHDELLVGWAADPAVTRFIGAGTPLGRAIALEMAARVRAHWNEHGFGWRVAFAAGQPVGFIMLAFAGEGAGIDAGDYEIGWWLAPTAWGQGYAREGAAALAEEAWRVGARSIAARIHPANAASIRVAEAIGMSFQRTSTGRAGEAISVYRLHAPAG